MTPKRNVAVEVTPAVWQAYEALTTLSSAQLARGPGRALARLLNVDHSTAQRYVRRLVDVGLASRTAQGKTAIYSFAEGRVHDHGPLQGCSESCSCHPSLTLFRAPQPAVNWLVPRGGGTNLGPRIPRVAPEMAAGNSCHPPAEVAVPDDLARPRRAMRFPSRKELEREDRARRKAARVKNMKNKATGKKIPVENFSMKNHEDHVVASSPSAQVQVRTWKGTRAGKREGTLLVSRKGIDVFVFKHKAGRKPFSQRDQLLIDIYTARRQQVQPGFSVNATLRPIFVEARKTLESLGIPDILWGCYVGWVSERFYEITNGRMAFLPVKRGWHQSWIEGFVAQAGWESAKPTRSEMERALRSHGRQPANYNLRFLWDCIKEAVKGGLTGDGWAVPDRYPEHYRSFIKQVMTRALRAKNVHNLAEADLTRDQRRLACGDVARLIEEGPRPTEEAGER